MSPELQFTITDESENLLEIIKVLRPTSAVNLKKKSVRTALRYIDQHYQEVLTLDMVAQVVNLNPVYFSNMFKKETSENFLDCVHKRRIKAAKDILRTQNDSIGKIAMDVGYFDAKYFSKIFKKYVGIRPSEYRNMYG